MLENDVPLAFGSDFPVESPNPFPGLAVAITRRDAQGQPPGGWMPEQALILSEALAAFTTGAAYAGFAAARLGSLAKGKLADFLLRSEERRGGKGWFSTVRSRWAAAQ